MSDKPKFYSCWDHIDQAKKPEDFSSFLDKVSSLDSYQEYKRKSFELMNLKGGERVIDVGCGTGQDLLTIASIVGSSGNVVGLDISEFMLQETRKKFAQLALQLDTLHGSAINIPSEDNTFDACRCDRVLKYLSNPIEAFSEFSRVTKIGGRVVVFDQDWDTWTVDTEHKEFIRKIRDLRCDEFTNGLIGRQLPGLAEKVGLTQIQTTGHLLERRDLDDLKRILKPIFTIALQRNLITQEEIAEFLIEQEGKMARGEFFTAVTIFGVAGVKA
jgi:ubiquinone/menaquinone biosynthesis C-methylase UbiE